MGVNDLGVNETNGGHRGTRGGVRPDRAVEGLRSAVRGRVLLPGDDGFEAAGRAWNLAVDQRVRAVVEAADADDVAAVVGYAHRAGVPVAAQTTGHGASVALDGAILLRTSALDEVEVDPETRRARVGAGVQWGRVLEEAGRHGLTGLAGSSPVVGVAGFTLGGGLSWFSRAYGSAASAVRAFDVLGADGVPARVSEDSDPDLFWALCGGGGGLAVVTAVEFDLFPAPELYGGRVLWPATRAEEVLAAYLEITAQAPPELSVWFSRLSFPGAPPMVAVDAAFLGGAEEARSALLPLDGIGDTISDRRGVLPVAELGSITADPVDPAPGRSRTELLTGLDARAAKYLITAPTDPVMLVQLRHLGGALDESAPGPVGLAGESYLLYTFGVPVDAETGAALAARQGELVRGFGSAVSGRKPYTFLGADDTVESAFSEADLARLRGIKADRDPKGLLRSAFPLDDSRPEAVREEAARAEAARVEAARVEADRPDARSEDGVSGGDR